MFTVPRGAPLQHYVQVEVINTGIVTVIVAGIFYRPHRWAKGRLFVQPYFSLPLTTRLPATVRMGESARFLWKPADWREGVSSMLAKEFLRMPIYRHIWSRFLICEVKVSTGEIFRAKLSRALLDQEKAAVEGGERAG